jgi:hypothetical protein
VTSESEPPADWYDEEEEEYFCPHGNSVPVAGGACYWCVQEDMEDDDG